MYACSLLKSAQHISLYEILNTERNLLNLWETSPSGRKIFYIYRFGKYLKDQLYYVVYMDAYLNLSSHTDREYQSLRHLY